MRAISWRLEYSRRLSLAGLGTRRTARHNGRIRYTGVENKIQTLDTGLGFTGQCGLVFERNTGNEYLIQAWPRHKSGKARCKLPPLVVMVFMGNSRPAVLQAHACVDHLCPCASTGFARRASGDRGEETRNSRGAGYCLEVDSAGVAGSTSRGL
ncbi:hypothetical protein KM043_017822 [Ampulex compressa]|nr:hypothetical protein KM043_017822 [Ampulex compressa]